MNDIITDFIGKQIANKLRQNRPVIREPTTKILFYTKAELKHLNKCHKQICDECSKILKGDNN